MTTIINNGSFKVQFNGSNTWFVIDSNGDCRKHFNSLLKAINFYNKVSKQSGITNE